MFEICVFVLGGRKVGGVDKAIPQSRDESWGYFVPRPMLSKCKHRYAVSRVFDDNLTVCSGVYDNLRVSQSNRVELKKKDGSFLMVVKGSKTRQIHKDGLARSASSEK